ncbi:TPA: hypothetical protein ACNAB0_003851 [Escherichia coli]
MIKVITLLLFALLTGCQSVESKIEELPTVGFDPILYNKSEAFTDGKVTLRVESSGTDVWLVAKNGTRSFIELSGLTLGGSRCAYNARSKQLLPPGSVSTFVVPTVGMLGLCFNNEDQLMFINRAFSRISPKAKGKDSLSLLFSVSYDFLGKADLINNHDFQELYLLFLNEDNL